MFVSVIKFLIVFFMLTLSGLAFGYLAFIFFLAS